jgi:hypothetical protein
MYNVYYIHPHAIYVYIYINVYLNCSFFCSSPVVREQIQKGNWIPLVGGLNRRLKISGVRIPGLVNVYITVENHYFLLVNQLSMAIFNSDVSLPEGNYMFQKTT